MRKEAFSKPRTRMNMIITDTPLRALDVVSMDLHGKMPQSGGFQWILTIICTLTKYFIAVPLEDSSALAVARGLIDT